MKISTNTDSIYDDGDAERRDEQQRKVMMITYEHSERSSFMQTFPEHNVLKD